MNMMKKKYLIPRQLSHPFLELFQSKQNYCKQIKIVTRFLKFFSTYLLKIIYIRLLAKISSHKPVTTWLIQM